MTERSATPARLRMGVKFQFGAGVLVAVWSVAALIATRVPGLWREALAIGAPALLTVAGVAIAAYRLRKRVDTLFEAADRLARGEWETPLVNTGASSTADEFDRLLGMLEQTRARNAELLAGVESAAARVQRSSRALSNTAQGLYSDISTFSMALEQVVDGAVAQAAETDAMQNGIDKLATETVDHRKLALDTEGDSRSTRTAGIESSRAITGILERWEVQLADLREVDRDVGAFEETAREISTIVEVIGEIAHRTHVLSLNAGLEALRAGDQGTGFVGLAEEIRGLSEDTARRADSIEAILGRFQSSLGRLIDRLRTNIQALDEGRTHVGTVRQRLQVIIDGTEAVSDGVVRLARAFEQQAERMAVLRAQAGLVHQTTTNHARVVGETVTRSRDQMIVGADELRHEARELDRVASDLAARAGSGKGQAA